MTIAEAIAAVDELRENDVSREEKIRWLSNLDKKIKQEFLDQYEETVDFDGYSEETDGNTDLLIPPPYDELYLYHLESMIHYRNEEMTRYNNAITLFNDAYADFRKHYNRNHRAKSVKVKYF